MMRDRVRLLLLFWMVFGHGLAQGSPSLDYYQLKLQNQKDIALTRACDIENRLNALPVSCMKSQWGKALAVTKPEGWSQIWKNFSQQCIVKSLQKVRRSDLVWVKNQKLLSRLCRARVSRQIEDMDYIRKFGQKSH